MLFQKDKQNRQFMH